MKYINNFNSVIEALNGNGYSPNVTYVKGSLNKNNLVYTNIGDDKEIEFKLDTDGKVKGEEKVVMQPLTFTTEEAGSTVKLVKYGTPDEISLQYSTNGTTWNDYTIGDVITLSSIGDKVMFSATDTNQTFSKYFSNQYKFAMTGKIAASGNITSLLDKTMQRMDVPDYCYYGMFYRCTSLTTAPELPATTLADYCYDGMFEGCTSLTQAPELPATTLADWCYVEMFSGCTSLTTSPELPATTLAPCCYFRIFNECTSLVEAPSILPATNLPENEWRIGDVGFGCYDAMFYGCTSLTTAPTLPATTLSSACYFNMFFGCTSLTQAPELPATTLAEACYCSMFWGCTSLIEAPELPATTLANPKLGHDGYLGCYEDMFRGCTALTEAPELPATTLAVRCYCLMFYGCTSLTTAPELPATELPLIEDEEFVGWSDCYSMMFYDCTSLTTAPELPATHLTPYCYSEMFGECTNLSSITMLAEDVSAEGCLDNWVSGVAEEGTLRLCTELDLPEGESGIPYGWTVEYI